MIWVIRQWNKANSWQHMFCLSRMQMLSPVRFEKGWWVVWCLNQINTYQNRQPFGLQDQHPGPFGLEFHFETICDYTSLEKMSAWDRRRKMQAGIVSHQGKRQPNFSSHGVMIPTLPCWARQLKHLCRSETQPPLCDSAKRLCEVECCHPVRLSQRIFLSKSSMCGCTQFSRWYARACAHVSILLICVDILSLTYKICESNSNHHQQFVRNVVQLIHTTRCICLFTDMAIQLQNACCDTLVWLSFKNGSQCVL